MGISPIEFLEDACIFCIPGQPRGKERPRTVRIGNRITTYTPKNTVEYENLIRKSYRSVNGNKILKGPIEANLIAIYPIPKSISKKNKQKIISGEIPCIKKPDCDNIAKIVLDALNSVAYEDDSQIRKLSVQKKYGENPMVKVKLKEIY